MKILPPAAGLIVCALVFVFAFYERAIEPIRIEIEGVDVAQYQKIRIERKSFFSKKKQIYPMGGVWETRKTALSLLLSAPPDLLSSVEKVKITVGDTETVLLNSDIVDSRELKISERFFVLNIPKGNLKFVKHLQSFAFSLAAFLFISFVCGWAISKMRCSRISTGTAASTGFCALSVVFVLTGFPLLSAALAATAFFFIVFSLFSLPSPHRKPAEARPGIAITIKKNPLVCFFLFISFVLCLRGINWGIAESWNPDQMALKLSVQNFDRAHFVSLMHLFLSRLPVAAADALLNLPADGKKVVLLISRMIHLAMFLGCGVFIYIQGKKVAGKFSAALVAGIFVLSPGYAAFSKFLTADIPLLFLMLASFHFCLNIMDRGKTRDYIVAGLLAGIAAAAKYYGVAVCVAIITAHFLRCKDSKTGLKNTILSRNLVLGICWIPLGFFLGDPLALANFKEFISDFYLNSLLVPVDGINTQGYSFISILSHSFELFSPPIAILVLISNIFGFYLFFKDRISPQARLLLFASWILFASYFLKFGFFPRSEVRYSLPFFAFLVPVCAVFFSALGRKLALGISAPLLFYISMCLWVVGNAFASDPRMDAIKWFKGQCGKGCLIENNYPSPRWNKILGNSYQTFEMPFLAENIDTLLSLSGKNTALAIEKRVLLEQKNAPFYAQSNLESRRPDFISLNPSRLKKMANIYPEVNGYYSELFRERSKYRVVFNGKGPDTPAWAYPKHIDFLIKNLVILKRK